jgi:hypothetical protein
VYLGKKNESDLGNIESSLDNISKPDLQHFYSGNEIFKLGVFEKYLESKDTVQEELNLLSEEDGQQTMRKFKIKKLVVEKTEGWKKCEATTGFGYKYFATGELLYKGWFKDGNFSGRGIQYHKSSHPSFEGDFTDGTKVGFGTSYDEEGNICFRYQIFPSKKNQGTVHQWGTRRRGHRVLLQRQHHVRWSLV